MDHSSVVLSEKTKGSSDIDHIYRLPETIENQNLVAKNRNAHSLKKKDFSALVNKGNRNKTVKNSPSANKFS